MYDLVSIGEMLIDFTPCGTGQNNAPLYLQNPGGAPANVACSMAKLGRNATFVGKVGDDLFGRACRTALENAGCDSSHLILSKTFATTLAFVTLSPDGNRDFSFYRNLTTADVNLLPEDIPGELLHQGKIFHFGSVSLTQEPSRSTVLETIKQARDAGAIISYDPNLRPPLWGSLDFAKTTILEALPLCHLLKISDDEQNFLFGTEPEEEVGRRLFEEYGIILTVITKAKQGCSAFLNGRKFVASAYDVETIDTTGAGDSFWAGLLLRLLELNKAPDTLTDEEMEDVLRFANALGSLVTTKRGAIAAIPTREEIETCIREGKLL